MSRSCDTSGDYKYVNGGQKPSLRFEMLAEDTIVRVFIEMLFQYNQARRDRIAALKY